ncbi:clusterin isoform X1 [Petromyzon marinus]|uniref:clusterin isoform X1 n=2 Tax=Petromyzon marinus TaxID=7757 RepID=UPI003F7240A1
MCTQSPREVREEGRAVASPSGPCTATSRPPCGAVDPKLTRGRLVLEDRQNTPGTYREALPQPRAGTTMGATASRRLLLLMHVALLMLLMTMMGAKPGAALTVEQLQKLSTDGGALLDRELKRGFRGLRVLKTFADRNEEKHVGLQAELKRALEQKQEAIELARDAHARLDTRGKACNASLWPAWESECRPCLERSCKRFVSLTCGGGGGGLGGFGRDVDRFFQRFNPFSFILGDEADEWLNLTDVTNDDGGKSFATMEEHFHNLSEEVTNLFQRSSSALASVTPTLADTLGQDLVRWFRTPLPSRAGFRAPRSLDWMDHSPFLRWPERTPLLGLSEDQLFWSSPTSIRPGLGPVATVKNLLERLFGVHREVATAGDKEEEHTVTSSGGFGQEGDAFRCKQIQRSSKGCLAMKVECERCEALVKECPELGTLQREQTHALDAVESSWERYNRTLDVTGRHLRESARLLDSMMHRFGWVSRLVESLGNSSVDFHVETVLSREGTGGEGASGPPDTAVSVRLYDSQEPMTFSVPGSLAWDDPHFIRTVVERALRQYQERGSGENATVK